eukprot:12938147-Prorocentrum_lima.AAC.1
MAHTGQIDGLPPYVSEEQDPETSHRQEIKMMDGTDQHDEATTETDQGTITIKKGYSGSTG